MRNPLLVDGSHQLLMRVVLDSLRMQLQMKKPLAIRLLQMFEHLMKKEQVVGQDENLLEPIFWA